MKTIRPLLLPLLGCAFGGLAMLGCLHLAEAHAAALAAAGPAATPVPIDWGFWLTVATALGVAASAVFHAIAAKTHSAKLEAVARVVDEMRGVLPAASAPAPGPTLVKGSGTAGLLAILLLGALAAPALTGCASQAAQQIKSDGKVAAVAVLDCEKKLARGQLEQGLVLLGSDIASMLLEHGAIDWAALATAALADASDVRTCAIAEYHAVMAAQPGANPVAAAKLYSVNPPPVNPLEAAIARIKAARGVSVIATPGGPI